MTRQSLTTLNMGLGRDSIAMLCLLAEGKLVAEDEVIAPSDIDAVIFSDTGAEWVSTYELIPRVQALCDRIGVRFIVLAKPAKHGRLGWRSNLRARGDRSDPAWVRAGEGRSIEEKAALGAYHRRLPIMDEFKRFAKIAVTVSSSCTDNHKVQPIRRVMNDLSLERFGVSNRSWSAAVKRGDRPKHRVIIGIAADEASRAINTGRPAYEHAVYPLVEMGINKADEAAILARHGFADVHKSGCVMCPYQPIGWFWVLRQQHPALWAEVVEYERVAHAANPKMFVVSAKAGRLLPEAVDHWRRLNPDATIEAVMAKSYSRCPVWRDETKKREAELAADEAVLALAAK